MVMALSSFGLALAPRRAEFRLSREIPTIIQRAAMTLTHVWIRVIAILGREVANTWPSPTYVAHGAAFT